MLCLLGELENANIPREEKEIYIQSRILNFTTRRRQKQTEHSTRGMSSLFVLFRLVHARDAGGGGRATLVLLEVMPCNYLRLFSHYLIGEKRKLLNNFPEHPRFAFSDAIKARE